MPTRIAGNPAEALAAWFAPLAEDPAGAVAFLAEVADRVSRRSGAGRVLVLGGGPVADALAGEGYPVTAAHLDRGVPAGLRFDVVFAGSDELSRLPGQRDQLRLVRRLAGLLRPGGALVIQAYHPDPAGYGANARVSEHDCARQTLSLTGTGTSLRYVWPAELDLMAELAELALDGRWGGWYAEPVTCGAPVVSVFRS